ncbi:MAG: UPF0149 family protein [Gammaproteobacteria bacterium]|nr:UPF0149 family protein [Gammaproteobacteria bacterium]
MSELYSLALDTAVGISVEALHGTVVGLAAARGDTSADDVAVALTNLLADEISDVERCDVFVRAAVDDLEHEDLTFAPLLPDDDEALPFRLEALKLWVSGFLVGLRGGYAAVHSGDFPEQDFLEEDSPEDDIPEEVEEIVADFDAIAEIDVEADGDEGNESSYAELVEFVRVAVLLTRESV